MDSLRSNESMVVVARRSLAITLYCGKNVIWNDFKSNHKISNQIQIKSHVFQIKSLFFKPNHYVWFNHGLNQIMIWICPSLPRRPKCVAYCFLCTVLVAIHCQHWSRFYSRIHEATHKHTQVYDVILLRHEYLQHGARLLLHTEWRHCHPVHISSFTYLLCCMLLFSAFNLLLCLFVTFCRLAYSVSIYVWCASLLFAFFFTRALLSEIKSSSLAVRCLERTTTPRHVRTVPTSFLQLPERFIFQLPFPHHL